MNKGVDLIQRVQSELIEGYPSGNLYIGVTEEEWEELNKELKALEIIKDKEVDIHDMKYCKNCEDYNGYSRWLGYRAKLTQEEYDLLKEVLL